MAEEKESRLGKWLRGALHLAGEIAAILLAGWTILGLPPIVVSLKSGTLSGIQAALAWAVPTLAVWVLAWRRRDALRPAIRTRYVSTLVRLSGPVREDLAQIPCADVGRPEDGGAVEAVGARQEGEPALAKREFGDEIAELSPNASYVLFLVLKSYAQDGCQQAEVTLWAPAVRIDLWGVGDPLSRACRELVYAQLLTDWELSNGGESLRAVLADRLRGRREVSRFMELLDEHLRESYFWDSDTTIIP